jgi:hydroxypyruvate reductase
LAGRIPETPKPGENIFDRSHNFLVATNHMALEAAKLKAFELGYNAIILDRQLQGEAREKAIEFVDQLRRTNAKESLCLLMGGETTVTIKGNGKGGRNQEFALAALCEMEKLEVKIPAILSAGTDGSDGPTDATGAFADEGTITAMVELQLDPKKYLDNNDAYTFFNKTGGLIITGATQTNVMDIVIGITSPHG